MEEVCEPHGRLSWKRNHILVKFDHCIIVSLWTFQPTLVHTHTHTRPGNLYWLWLPHRCRGYCHKAKRKQKSQQIANIKFSAFYIMVLFKVMHCMANKIYNPCYFMIKHCQFVSSYAACTVIILIIRIFVSQFIIDLPMIILHFQKCLWLDVTLIATITNSNYTEIYLFLLIHLP